jgi:hypothetical protein
MFVLYIWGTYKVRNEIDWCIAKSIIFHTITIAKKVNKFYLWNSCWIFWLVHGSYFFYSNDCIFLLFYLCLSVCQYLWIIKFLEWAYRKKWGDMRGYFHRLEYWGFIFRLILLRFSFVFFINLPIRKSYRMVLKGNNNGTVLQGAFKRESPQKQTKLIRSSTIWIFNQQNNWTTTWGLNVTSRDMGQKDPTL